MRTIGRGRDYQKALDVNLIRSIKEHKRIKTTRGRARRLARLIPSHLGGTIELVNFPARRGDGAFQVLVLWKKEEKQEQNENTTNTTKPDRKKVAPRRSKR